MKHKDLIQTLNAISDKEDEINFYYKGKKLDIKEFCVTIDGEYKINLERKNNDRFRKFFK